MSKQGLVSAKNCKLCPEYPYRPAGESSCKHGDGNQSLLDIENALNDFDGELNCEVLIVGAGPAGLMLAANLARCGIDFIIIDDRPGKTQVGRADGLQPKTIETFRHLGLAEQLLKEGVKAYDISFWNSTETSKLSRTSRQVHYPSSSVDTLDPYVLLVSQGMIEDVLIKDLASRNKFVQRNTSFITCREGPYGDYLVNAHVRDGSMVGRRETGGRMVTGERVIKTKFVAGCDGAHSKVRGQIPQEKTVGASVKSEWGVIDGILDTDFPDIWTKAVVQSRTAGSLLCIPREHNLTRLYVELGNDAPSRASHHEKLDRVIVRRAKEILSPYSIKWDRIVWASVYAVSQRACSAFISPGETIYIVGDAAHTHSPKAAQGMNVSMHDAFNLAWKLNLFLRKVAQSSLLITYEEERALVAQQLIAFDIEHAKAFESGDSRALAKNFDDNIRFISGIGVEYKENIVNIKLPEGMEWKGQTKLGALLPPARVTRYIDSNPVDIQLDIPLLGQFRIYFLVSNIHKAARFLEQTCDFLISQDAPDNSTVGQASALLDECFQFSTQIRDVNGYRKFERYTKVSDLFTPAIVTTMKKDEIEISHLPSILCDCPWTFYLDNQPDNSCTMKWAGEMTDEDVVIINVRPDGYVGGMNRFRLADLEGARLWLNSCFAFLRTFKTANQAQKLDSDDDEENPEVYRSIFGRGPTRYSPARHRPLPMRYPWDD